MKSDIKIRYITAKKAGISKIVIFLMAVLLFGCNSIDTLTAEKENLLQTDRDFSEMSVEKGAAEAFNYFLTTDALQLPAGRNPVMGRETIYSRMKKSQHSYILSWTPQDGEVAESSDWGYTWGLYELTMVDSVTGNKTERGKYLNIWKKNSKDEWRVAVDMGNENPE